MKLLHTLSATHAKSCLDLASWKGDRHACSTPVCSDFIRNGGRRWPTRVPQMPPAQHLDKRSSLTCKYWWEQLASCVRCQRGTAQPNSKTPAPQGPHVHPEAESLVLGDEGLHLSIERVRENCVLVSLEGWDFMSLSLPILLKEWEISSLNIGFNVSKTNFYRS